MFNKVICVTERFSTNKCIKMVMSVICQYIFPLCDTKTGQMYTLSQEGCINIQEECKLEYHILKSLHLAVLPDCFSLPKANSTSKLHDHCSIIDFYSQDQYQVPEIIQTSHVPLIFFVIMEHA